MARLAQWIGNVESEEEQKLLLEYALHISFFAHADFEALYQSAFSGPITRWVIEQSKLRLDAPGFTELLAEELQKRTWYCPVTDSMDINEFYHLNHITGIRHRPSFSTLAMLDPLSRRIPHKLSTVAQRMLCYMASPARRVRAPSLKRLVLLEDFVGSGSQAVPALLWAIATLKCPILFVPLIICPSGSARLAEIVAAHPNHLEIRPVMEIGPRDLLGPRRPQYDGWRNAAQIELLAEKVHPRLNCGNGPFGFEDTGCSVVTFTNTPNNTVSLIHQPQQENQWVPLFPRSARI